MTIPARGAHTPAQPQIVPFWYQLRKVWLYPLHAGPLMVMGMAAALSLLTMFPGFYARILDVMILAYVYRYGGEILQHTARGNLAPPEYVTRVEGNQGWLQIWLTTAFAILAFLALFILGPGFGGALALLLLLGYPAASIIVAIEGDFWVALSPLRWFDAMARIGWPYLAVVLLCCAFFFSKVYLDDYLGFLWLPFATVLKNFVAYYFAIMSFFLLGYLVHQFHDELGFEQETPVSSLPDPRRKFDPDQGVLDEAEALAQAGKFEQAAATLAVLIKGRGAGCAVHQRYRKLLAVLEHTDAQLAHGQQWLPILIAQEKPAEAAALYQECLKLDGKFRPVQAEDYHPLATALETSKPELAVALLNGFHREFPKSKAILPNLLLAAKILAERQNRVPLAQQIVAQLVTKYAAHADAPKLLEYQQYLEKLSPTVR